MEDEVERTFLRATIGLDLVLRVLQDVRAKLDVTRLVDAVRVAERRRDRELADAVERIVRLQDLLRLRVEARAVDVRVVDAVLFASGHAQLDLERHVHLRHPLEVLLRYSKVLIERFFRQVEHVRAEQRPAVLLVVLLAELEHAVDPLDDLQRAVVGVQDDRDTVVLGKHADVVRAGDRARDRRALVGIVEELPGVELTTAVGKLDDDGSIGLSGRLHRRVDRVAAHDIDRRKRARNRLAVLEDLLKLAAGNDTGLQL